MTYLLRLMLFLTGLMTILVLLATGVGGLLPSGGQILANGRVRPGTGDDLILIDVARGLIVPLTHHPAQDSNGVWSPDGQQIAFISSRRVPLGDGERIYIMDASGRNLRQLTFSDTHNAAPRWSPDGRRIAYVSFSPQRRFQQEIFLINADGSNDHALTTIYPLLQPPYNWINPLWSPDGALLYAALVGQDGGDIYGLYPDASSPPISPAWHQDIHDWGMSPTFAPDGRSFIAVMLNLQPGDSPGSLYRYDFATNVYTRLNLLPGFYQGLSYAPDGKRIVYSYRSGFQSSAQIYSGSVDGSNRRRLTDFGTNTSPAYSPDGRFVLYWHQHNGQSSLCIVAAAGGAPACPLAWRGGAAWRPGF